MNMNVQLNWESFKNQINPTQMVWIEDSPSTYIVWTSIGVSYIVCYLSDALEIQDFENNYKAQANASSSIEQLITINGLSVENIGTTGIGVYKDTVDNKARLKKINNVNNKLSVIDDIVNNKIDLQINETNINHNNLSGGHNLTTDINHNNILNGHNLTTDIIHNNIGGLNSGEFKHLTTTEYNNLHTHTNKSNLDSVNQNLGTTGTPTFANLINNGLTINQIVETNGSKQLISAVKSTAYNQNFSTTPSDIKMDGSQSLGISSNIPRADHVHPSDTTKENFINVGSMSQYWRGDKTWQNLDKNAVGLNNVLNVAQIPTTEKGANNGVATLDSTGKIPTGQLPAIAITDTFVVPSQSDMLLLNAQTGDVAVRTDVSKSFILKQEPASALSNWQELLSAGGGGSIISVNGQTGVVVLTTTNINEGTNLYFTTSRVLATQLSGYTAASGNITASDTILQAIQKLGFDKHVPITLGTANGLSLNVQQLSLQLASGSQNGALSSTDWNTFNNKENAITAGTTSQYWRGDKTWQTLNNIAVGLGNVTNEAQLKRSANDFNSFTLKPTIGLTDRFLLENGSTGVKEYTTYDSVLPVFGRGFEETSDPTASSTTGTTLLDKLVLTYTPSETGKYRIGSYCTVRTSAANKAVNVVITSELGDIGDNVAYLSNVVDTRALSIWGFQTLTAGVTYNFRLQWARKGSSTTAYIRNAKIEIYRVS